ncbi:MAG TPA: hypothetical protein PLJ35_12065 [Anaerolineae bacterium]|nr:hypothetical protein [Anaerolineae bacterium]HOQ99547.1 hypothetical protein [Anaerolineae bacterium]HPL27851.1 hypothetical protein [Anaerolineae bacterium]
MTEFRGACDVPSSASEDVSGGEALYNQGMAHYRRREWRQARQSFLRLKAVEPCRHGIDALLDELEIFIRLDSLASAAPAVAVDVALPTAGPIAVMALWPRRWRLIVGLGGLALLAALAFLFSCILSPRAARRVEELRSLAQAQRAGRNWSKSIDVCEEWLLVAPADAQARSGLWTAYYERGDQRAGEARALEAEAQYAPAAERWEGALADFRAAQQVDPGHAGDPRGETAARIQAAERARRCAALMAQALDWHQRQRWPEAMQVLAAVREADPGYRAADVARAMGQAQLGLGREALAAAASPAEIGQAVRLLAQAAAALPADAAAQATLQQAQTYLQAAQDVAAGEWHAAVAALQPLLFAEAAFAGGRARALLCRAQFQRAGERYQAGLLRAALADYRAVAAAGCVEAAEAQRWVDTITLALVPTPAPTPMPAATPLPTATPAP